MYFKRLFLLLVFIVNLSIAEDFINGEKPKEIKCIEKEIEIKRINPKEKKCQSIILKNDCELKKVIYGTSKYSMWKKCPEKEMEDFIPTYQENDITKKYYSEFIINEIRENNINETMEKDANKKDLEFIKNQAKEIIILEQNLKVNHKKENQIKIIEIKKEEK